MVTFRGDACFAAVGELDVVVGSQVRAFRLRQGEQVPQKRGGNARLITVTDAKHASTT